MTATTKPDDDGLKAMMSLSTYADGLKKLIGRPVLVYADARGKKDQKPRKGIYIGTSTRYNGSDYIGFEGDVSLEFEDVSDDRWVWDKEATIEVAREFPSQFDIGDPVWVELEDTRKVSQAGLMGWVRYVTFTTGKVRYGVFIDGCKTTIHNIDSVFVLPRDFGGQMEFGADNLS